MTVERPPAFLFICLALMKMDIKHISEITTNHPLWKMALVLKEPENVQLLTQVT